MTWDFTNSEQHSRVLRGMSVSQDTQLQKKKKTPAVKPPVMDKALGRRTYQEQVMNSYGKGNHVPFIPKLSAGSHDRMVGTSAKHSVKSQTQTSAMREAIAEVPPAVPPGKHPHSTLN